MRVAYRMLGSVADAEDVVQEAFIRWMRTDRGEVREPEAFLRRTVTRLCLDQLKSARHQRETYIGPWLPDPVVEEEEEEDVTLPLMLALERLSPLERAAFLLHDVFGLGFEEVARHHRARPGRLPPTRGPGARPMSARRGRASRWKSSDGLELAEAFFAASRSGDMKALGAMLAADVSVHADGGGKRPAATEPILGFDAVMKAPRASGGAVPRSIPRNSSAPASSTDCPASSRSRPMANCRRPRSKSRTARSRPSMWCETPTS